MLEEGAAEVAATRNKVFSSLNRETSCCSFSSLLSWDLSAGGGSEDETLISFPVAAVGPLSFPPLALILCPQPLSVAVAVKPNPSLYSSSNPSLSVGIFDSPLDPPLSEDDEDEDEDEDDEAVGHKSRLLSANWSSSSPSPAASFCRCPDTAPTKLL